MRKRRPRRSLLRRGSSVYLPFVLNLATGLSRFEINQHTCTLFFRDLTAFQISIPAQAGSGSFPARIENRNREQSLPPPAELRHPFEFHHPIRVPCFA